MNATHTPGPWKPVKMVRGKHAGGVGIKPIDDLAPALAILPAGGPPDIREANARLIAQAPEMLAVLKATRVLWDMYGLGDTDAESEPVYLALRKVLDNAEAA